MLRVPFDEVVNALAGVTREGGRRRGEGGAAALDTSLVTVDFFRGSRDELIEAADMPVTS